jgi:hypothetical protein
MLSPWHFDWSHLPHVPTWLVFVTGWVTKTPRSLWRWLVLVAIPRYRLLKGARPMLKSATLLTALITLAGDAFKLYQIESDGALTAAQKREQAIEELTLMIPAVASLKGADPAAFAAFATPALLGALVDGVGYGEEVYHAIEEVIHPSAAAEAPVEGDPTPA